jgi:hypothetical protein
MSVHCPLHSDDFGMRLPNGANGLGQVSPALLRRSNATFFMLKRIATRSINASVRNMTKLHPPKSRLDSALVTCLARADLFAIQLLPSSAVVMHHIMHDEGGSISTIGSSEEAVKGYLKLCCIFRKIIT